MRQKDFDMFIKDIEWMSCPICGFRDCLRYSKGKNKGLYRCHECNIRWTKPKIINKIK